MADDPRLEEILLAAIESSNEAIHVSLPGKVKSWSRTTETATIEPLVRFPGGDPMPVIQSAKVCFPGVYWDLSAGEIGIVVFSDYDFARWWRSGSAQEPEHLGQHDYSSAMFIPGLRNKAGVRGCPAGATVLPGTDIRIGGNLSTEPAIKGTALMTPLLAFATTLTTAVNFAQVQAAATSLINAYAANDPKSTVVKVS